MEKRIIIVLALIIAILLLAFSFSEMKGKKKEEMVVSMKIIPSEFTLQEGGSTEIVVELKVNNMPYIAKINWSIESSGNTGKLVFENESVTDSNGILKAEYFAPDDVDEMQQYIKIIARVKIGGHEYFATANATVYPLLYQTLIEVEKEREKIIAGETNILRAKLFANIDGWLPLKNKTIIWKFYANGKEMMVKESKTNGLGISEIPFFYSNAAENVSIVAEAIFERNLSGEIDYEGCHANLSFTVIPEKPGDFPVDFDVTKPGIQWLTYEPSWFEEHHIPWIAAKVCEKIKEALVLNGYPPNQTIDIVAHSMGGLVARFMAEHYMADVDYWNKDWNGTGYPWYGDGDADITLGPYQIDDLIAVGTPCHGVPPNINESFLRSIIKYAYFPWWMGQVPDMIYDAPFLQAMGYKGTDLVDYYGVGGDIGVIIGDYPVDFDGDGIPHYSDGLCPTESPYLEGKPLYILEGHAWPVGEEDHISLIAINEKVHEYILEHLIL